MATRFNKRISEMKKRHDHVKKIVTQITYILLLEQLKKTDFRTTDTWSSLEWNEFHFEYIQAMHNLVKLVKNIS